MVSLWTSPLTWVSAAAGLPAGFAGASKPYSLARSGLTPSEPSGCLCSVSTLPLSAAMTRYGIGAASGPGGEGEGEGRVQRVNHFSGGAAKLMPTLSLLLLPLLQYRVLVDVEALRYKPQPIKPLTVMVLGRQIQEQAGSKEGR